MSGHGKKNPPKRVAFRGIGESAGGLDQFSDDEASSEGSAHHNGPNLCVLGGGKVCAESRVHGAS